MKPLISCIVSNYNTEPEMFRKAIDSILEQTLTDFELILIDDKSTIVESTNVIREYEKRDSRIVAIYNEQNKGLAGALNIGLEVAKGDYIARFDTDDICVRDRFEKQIAYMKKNKLDICSTFAHLFGKYDNVVSTCFYSCEDVASQLLFSCYIYHTPVIMKRAFLLEHGLMYDETFDGAEDFDLFTRCRQAGARIAIMPEVMFHYRLHSSSVCHTQKPKQIELSQRICKRQLDEMKLSYSKTEWNLNLILCGLKQYAEKENDDLEKWCEKLINANQSKLLFDKKSFSKVIYNRYLGAVLKSDISMKKKVIIIFQNRKLFSFSNIYAIAYKTMFSMKYQVKGKLKNAIK